MKTSAFFLLATLSAASAFSPVSLVSNNAVTKATVSTTALNIFGTKEKAEEKVETQVPAPVAEDAKETEKDNMMQQIKSAGTAGALSLFLWELAFWAISIPVAIFGFVQVNGAWPDFGNQEDVAKVGAEAFAFANVARLALPVRIGLAVATIPWVDENIVQASWAPDFLKKEKKE